MMASGEGMGAPRLAAGLNLVEGKTDSQYLGWGRKGVLRFTHLSSPERCWTLDAGPPPGLEETGGWEGRAASSKAGHTATSP